VGGLAGWLSPESVNETTFQEGFWIMITELEIKNAKPREKPYSLSDGDGLLLLVKESGAKSWVLRYHRDGKEKRAGLGKYPKVGLAKARELKNVFKRELALGGDPQKRKKKERKDASSNLGFRFLSPTGFKRDDRQFFLPLPELVFGSLLRKYRLLVHPDFYPELETIFPQIRVHSYNIANHAAQLRNNRILSGFCGETAYSFENLSDAESDALLVLAILGFFAGVGYKTTQGMGEVLPFWRELK
jgi:CRISPR-associated endoribonuclease Cas6